MSLWLPPHEQGSNNTRVVYACISTNDRKLVDNTRDRQKVERFTMPKGLGVGMGSSMQYKGWFFPEALVMTLNWHHNDFTQARREGWRLVIDLEDGPELHRDDETGLFKNDISALTHVKERTDAFAQRALSVLTALRFGAERK